MNVSLNSGTKVSVRLVCDYHRAFGTILARNLKNMTGNLANEGCYDPRLKGNSRPLFVYRIDFRTWLLSDTLLTREEAEEAVGLEQSRPKFLDRLIQEDIAKYDAEAAEEDMLEQHRLHECENHNVHIS